MTGEWTPGRYQVAVAINGDAARLETRHGIICGPFAIGPAGPDGAELVHIPTGQLVAEADSARRCMDFHEALLTEFGALDWFRRDLAALTTADQYVRAQRLRRYAGCWP